MEEFAPAGGTRQLNSHRLICHLPEGPTRLMTRKWNQRHHQRGRIYNG